MFKNFLSLLLLTKAVLSYSKYEAYSDARMSYLACNLAIRNSATFCDSHDYSCPCSNPNNMASIAGCLNSGKPPNGNEKDYLQVCEENYNITISDEMYLAAYENYTKNAVSTSDIENFNKTKPIDVPIKLDSSLMNDYRIAYDNFLGNYNDSLYYGSGMLAYWALVMLLCGISHWAKFLCPGIVKKFTGPFSNFWRKYITLPAVGRKSKTNNIPFLKIFTFLAPTRIETIIIVGFCAVTIFGNAHNISYYEGDPIFKTKTQALKRYTADRTGITATTMVPLVILFAGRNNFLQWVTGINFATFITYHKWVARVMFTLVVIHAALYTAIFVSRGALSEDYQYEYMRLGAVATVAGGIIWMQSILYLRRRWYEIFLLIHICMAAAFIAGAWYHVIDMGYLEFLYASIACWSFDRAVRIARLIHFGFPKATVTLLANDTLKIIVRRPKFWPATPGGHAFIHFLRPTCFWQSHPFTFTVSPDADENIVMYCKVKGGVTHGLYQYLHTHPGKSTQIRVTLEGPYGEPTPAKVYDSAVFIAGGSGIPGIYSEAIDLAQRRSLQESNKLTKLHWIIKEYNSLFWFYDEILALKGSGLQCTIYVTQPKILSSDSEQEESFDEDLNEKSSSNEKEVHKIESIDFTETKEASLDVVNRIKRGLSHVTFKEGRPCIEDLVKSEIEESSGSVAFITCGHPVMVDAVRYSCAHSLHDSKGKRIDFFEQLQVWT